MIMPKALRAGLDNRIYRCCSFRTTTMIKKAIHHTSHHPTRPPLQRTDAIQTLRDSLTSQYAPWTSGVLPLLPSETVLFFKKPDGTSSALELGSTTQAQVAELCNACQPATFGRNQTDVLDETYRKAGKLDSPHFLWGFNPDSRDFAEKIASQLFCSRALEQGMRFELYKLNVYGMVAVIFRETTLKAEIGEGSFFKAHQDTPRDENMFASLVIVLPFAHKGGNLVLKHRDREFDFDGSVLLQDTSVPSVAYVAFFSDVEHEVLPMESGNRVTITYNIYFDKERRVPVPTPQSGVDGEAKHPFKSALRAFLEDKPARKSHGFLGFGLSHAYPIQSAISKPEDLKLKGSDATLIHLLKELNVKFQFYLLYCEDPKKDECPFRLLSRYIVEGDEDDEGELFYELATKSFLVWHRAEPSEGSCYESTWYEMYKRERIRFKTMSLEWITEPTDESLDRSAVVAYGNEHTIDYMYHQICVVADVGVWKRVKENVKTNVK